LGKDTKLGKEILLIPAQKLKRCSAGKIEKMLRWNLEQSEWYLH
jgi:hypothetical protein